jgi:hypothetical protein
LVVNVPVRVPPSSNVTPENEYTIFADALPFHRRRVNARTPIVERTRFIGGAP